MLTSLFFSDHLSCHQSIDFLSSYFCLCDFFAHFLVQKLDNKTLPNYMKLREYCLITRKVQYKNRFIYRKNVNVYEVVIGRF